RSLVARRLPALGRNADRQGAYGHGNEIEHAHDDKGLRHTDAGRALEIIHETDAERRTYHGAAAETHDGKAGGHAAPVGKPFDQRRDRRYITQAQTAAAKHAVAQIEQPDLMGVDTDGRDDETAAEAAGSDEHGAARTDLLQPFSAEGRRQTEKDD